MRLVNDWKSAWKWVSMNCMVWATVLLTVWATIPDDLKKELPHGVDRWVAVLLLITGIAGRLIRQGPKDGVESKKRKPKCKIGKPK